jgi:hypothetical protein
VPSFVCQAVLDATLSSWLIISLLLVAYVKPLCFHEHELFVCTVLRIHLIHDTLNTLLVSILMVQYSKFRLIDEDGTAIIIKLSSGKPKSGNDERSLDLAKSDY